MSGGESRFREETMHVVHPGVEKYLGGLLPEREKIFYELEKMAEEKKFPAVGPEVGTLLEFLARAVSAKRILELGSGFGYSGLWFARALPEDGEIILTDFDPGNEILARESFEKMGKGHLMDYKTGDALEILETMDGPFDIIFNDIDKEFYPRVVDPAYQLLRTGGLFITDNTLWYGKVARENPDDVTRSILEFNQKLKEHKGFLTLQLPLRDGLSLCMKLD